MECPFASTATFHFALLKSYMVKQLKIASIHSSSMEPDLHRKIQQPAATGDWG
jgi:hypothetical protein